MVKISDIPGSWYMFDDEIPDIPTFDGFNAIDPHHCLTFPKCTQRTHRTPRHHESCSRWDSQQASQCNRHLRLGPDIRGIHGVKINQRII